MIFTDEEREWLGSVAAFLRQHDWWNVTVNEAFAHADAEMRKRTPAALAATNLGDSSSKLGDGEGSSAFVIKAIGPTSCTAEQPAAGGKSPIADQALIDKARELAQHIVGYFGLRQSEVIIDLAELAERQARELAEAKSEIQRLRHFEEELESLYSEDPCPECGYGIDGGCYGCKMKAMQEKCDATVATQPKLLERANRVLDKIPAPYDVGLWSEIISLRREIEETLEEKP